MAEYKRESVNGQRKPEALATQARLTVRQMEEPTAFNSAAAGNRSSCRRHSSGTGPVGCVTLGALHTAPPPSRHDALLERLTWL